MSRIIFEEALRPRRAAGVVGTVLVALAVQMALWTGSTGAQTCPPGEICEPPNFPPTVRADRASVMVVEGQTATNTGTYSDNNADDDVTITASVGNVTKTGTNSGTWSWSLANAPLGRQQVIVTATDGMGASRSTAFTLTATLPNGKIAFYSTGDIYTMNPDGSGRTNLTFSNPGLDIVPAFSPDGTRIAFAFRNSFGDLDIAIMYANGLEARPLVQGPVGDSDPVFSPDGARIAYTNTRDGNGDIYIINVDGSAETILTNSPESDSDPAFSPDGSQIAFERGNDIYVMNADGSNQTRLTNNSAFDRLPTFSPDGTRIAFERGDDIYVMNAAPESATNQPQRLTDAPGSDREPSWSPDGTKIAFQSDRDGRVDSNGFSLSEIYVMNADGSNQTRLTNNTITDASPSWGGASDTAPPETTITTGPSGSVNGNSGEFGFSSSEPNSVFECSLDGSPFRRCISPTSYNLAEGQHTFQVRATDAAGNTDLTPASRTWTVDTAAPAAPAITAPADNARLNTASFNLSGTAEAGSRVELLEGTTSRGAATAASSGNWSITLSGVADGSHAYTARATDAASNVSAASAARTVIVDTVAPETTLDPSGPAGTVATGSASFSFSSEAGSTFECKLDSGAFEPCSSPKSYTGLSQGRHAFSVRAKDAVGNVDSSPASRTWTVDTVKPKVTGVSPANLAAGVAPGTNVTATFSEAMKANTITRSTFKLFKVNPNGTTTQITNVTVKPSSDGLKATLNPFGTSTTLLARNTKYKAMITIGAKDLAGNALERNFASSFTVGR